MKNLLSVTAAIESGTGLMMIIFPSVLSRILLGSSLEVPVAITIARIAGVAIFALGAASWISRNDVKSRAVRGLVTALMIYNIGTALVLIYTGFSGLSSISLLSVVMVHALMFGWCILELLKKAN